MSYLQFIFELEALPLRDGCDISSATPNSIVFSLHEIIASLLSIFTLITQQPFGMESWFSAWVCFICSVNLSAGTCPIFVASTECEIGLVHHLAVERRCDI